MSFSWNYMHLLQFSGKTSAYWGSSDTFRCGGYVCRVRSDCVRLSTSATAAVFVFHACIARLLHVPRVLTIYSPDYSNGRASGRGYRALGYPRTTILKQNRALPQHRHRDLTCNILWHCIAFLGVTGIHLCWPVKTPRTGYNI